MIIPINTTLSEFDGSDITMYKTLFSIMIYIKLLISMKHFFKWIRISTLLAVWPWKSYLLFLSFYFLFCKIKMVTPALPWWSSGKESACQRRGHRFGPSSRKIPHATGQLSQWATTAEPTCPRVQAPQKEKPLQWEARAWKQKVALARYN